MVFAIFFLAWIKAVSLVGHGLSDSYRAEQAEKQAMDTKISLDKNK